MVTQQRGFPELPSLIQLRNRGRNFYACRVQPLFNKLVDESAQAVPTASLRQHSDTYLYYAYACYGYIYTVSELRADKRRPWSSRMCKVADIANAACTTQPQQLRRKVACMLVELAHCIATRSLNELENGRPYTQWHARTYECSYGRTITARDRFMQTSRKCNRNTH